MITESTIYWITRLDSIKEVVCGVGATIAILATIIGFIASVEGRWKILIPMIILFIVGMVVGIGTIFIPNTKEYCAIKALPRLINNERVQELPDKVLDLADAWMEELKSDAAEIRVTK